MLPAKTWRPSLAATFPRSHENSVAQWMTDGNIVVIGHESEEKTLRTSQSQIEEVLGRTAHKGDGLLGQIGSWSPSWAWW